MQIEEYARMNKKLPLGWAIDAHGNDTTDPLACMRGGALLPLGGTREHSGHKGYCLSAMVDILCSVLSGGNWGPNVSKFAVKNDSGDVASKAADGTSKSRSGNGIGHFFGAMQIDGFRPVSEFKREMDKWVRTFRACKPIDPARPVLIPGDPEREAFAARSQAGIPLKLVVVVELLELYEKWRQELEGMGVGFIVAESELSGLKVRLAGIKAIEGTV
jgi:LDH2 family malate/lactate/ureidoglycolate dehydrogenase